MASAAREALITARLRHLYEDVTRLRDVAAPGIALHPADRRLAGLAGPARPPLEGVDAAQQHQEALLAATAGTLAMRVESVAVSPGGVFACMMGVLRAGGVGHSEAGESDRGEERRGRGDRRDRLEFDHNLDKHHEGQEKNPQQQRRQQRQQQQQQQQQQHHQQEDSNQQPRVAAPAPTPPPLPPPPPPRNTIEMPFCGVWQFDSDGMAVEHWENAADPAALARWLSSN